MSDPLDLTTLAARAYNGLRTSVVAAAIIGLIVGILVLIWPQRSLVAISLLFGIAVIISGIVRIILALAAPYRGGTRVFLAALGVITVICGVICLFHPGAVLLIAAVFIGVGWIVNGAQDIVAGIRNDRTVGARWMAFVAGIVSIVAGVIVLLLPRASLVTFMVWAGILLIVVSVATLCLLPRRAPAAR